MSATSKLLTDDINKCFAKFRRTMLILLNRRLLNKISAHFHYFVRQCAGHNSEKRGQERVVMLESKGCAIYKLIIKQELKPETKGKDVEYAFATWRTFAKDTVKKEYELKRGILTLVSTLPISL